MVYPDGVYDPRGAPPIPSWVVRRSAFDRFGPMRRRDECWSLPTQDWLFRAWRRGARARPRRGSDADRDHVGDAAQYVSRPPRARAAALVRCSCAAIRICASARSSRRCRIRRRRTCECSAVACSGRRLACVSLARIVLSLGHEPEAVYFYFNYPKRWGFLPRRGALFPVLYRRRGLPALERQMKTRSPRRKTVRSDSQVPARQQTRRAEHHARLATSCASDRRRRRARGEERSQGQRLPDRDLAGRLGPSARARRTGVPGIDRAARHFRVARARACDRPPVRHPRPSQDRAVRRASRLGVGGTRSTCSTAEPRGRC